MLLVLILLVSVYGVLAGAASLGFIRARRQDPAPDLPEWPSVSVVVPTAGKPDNEAVQQIQACDYPTERLEILVPANGPVQHSFRGAAGAAVRRVSVLKDSTEASLLSVPLESATEVAEGEIVLRMPKEGTVPSGWIRSMVRRCTPDTPIVSGPTVVDHEDLFLPRLHALQRLGALGFTGGASYVGVPVHPGLANVTVHVDASRSHPASTDMRRAATFTPAADAAVAVPPVSSFAELVDRQAQWLRRRVQASSWSVQGQAGGLWLLHTVLFACSIVAVALPAWRQPTLIALLGKMGADTVLSLPAANHYDQRGLLRSIVPSELMLVFTLPIAGVWALVASFPEVEF